jgi:hypothetical protein
MRRFLCILLGRHRVVAAVLVRADGRRAVLQRCEACGAAF